MGTTAAELDLDGYLRRIGCEKPAGPGLAALASLQRAHCAAVPFENLDILLGRPIPLALDALQAKLVAARRGGYCFEQNTLFQAVLERLGYRVTPLAARVRQGASAIRARTHMILRVDLPEGPFLADVGFGGDGPLEPIPLAEGAIVRTELEALRVVREEDGWVLQLDAGAGWADLYFFSLERQYPIDFEMANFFTSSHPRSAFVLNLTAQRSWPGRRVILRNRQLTVRTAEGAVSSEVRDPDHLLEVLDAEFGLAFPPATRFSQPAF